MRSNLPQSSGSGGAPDSFPRSLHLPVAITDGSSIRNLNEIGVRFWTTSSFNEDGEVGGGHTADAAAQIVHDGTSTNQHV